LGICYKWFFVKEIKRADCAADPLFAPTEKAAANLKREGSPEERIEPAGDVRRFSWKRQCIYKKVEDGDKSV